MGGQVSARGRNRWGVGETRSATREIVKKGRPQGVAGGKTVEGKKRGEPAQGGTKKN